MTDVAVIILTYNEEVNIVQALASVCGWAREVFLMDSFSADRTLELAADHPCRVYQRKFDNYSRQRNWALTEIPIQSKWVLFLDADEWVTEELKSEITTVLSNDPLENGFLINRRFYWNRRWVRRGYYPMALLRLFRTSLGKCEEREINEHLVVEGPTRLLKNDFIHEDHKGLADWTQKHIRYARLEAEQLFRKAKADEDLSGNLWGTQAERTRWIRLRIYNRLPPLIRPALYFFYRVVIRMGFLDGWQAMVYHFLHAFWCPLLIDLFYLEMKQKRKNHAPKETVSETAVAR